MTDCNRHWASGLRSLILKKLSDHGPQTTRELSRSCAVRQDAIAPRLSELEQLGQVRDTGERRSSLSGKGRKLKVWCDNRCTCPARHDHTFMGHHPDCQKQ